MKLSRINAEIPASFEYPFVDADGNAQTEQITLSLRRLSFGKTTDKDFRSAMENIAEDASEITKLLAGIIAKWNLFEDDAEQQMLPITEESIASLPTDFVGQMSEAVFSKLFPNPKNAVSSPNGSEQAESSTADSMTA